MNERAHLWALGSNGYDPDRDHALVPDAGEPVALSGPRRLWLTSFLGYRLEETEGEHGSWKVRTTAYFHALENEGGMEIVAYHWHPGGESAVRFPHLHIERGIGAALGEVHRYHFPTGRVALEAVLRLAVREFGAEPQRGDWSEVLDESQSAFEERSTWSGSAPPREPQ